MPNTLKSQFLLDPDVIYLNHGSLGACPRPVFAAYQHWQAELERQPACFMGHSAALLAEARAKLAVYLGVAADNLVYFTNPTTALNMVGRSLAMGDAGCGAIVGENLTSSAPPSLRGKEDGGIGRAVFSADSSRLPLQPGDEILTTDHEYGAMDRMWEFITHKTGARYVHRTIPLPVTSTEEFVEHFWAGVTERTKVVYLSHVTSPTALIFPVAEICRRAAEAGLISIVDGAHAPGQIPLNLAALGADVYVGACHKWLCAPKGSAFLYARPEAQQWLEPLVISRGWGHEPVDGHSPLVAYQEGQGTRDPAAFLAVPAAIQFQADHDWDAVRRRCHALAAETRQRINALTGLAPICPDGAQQIPGFPAETGHLWFGQFVTIRLPDLDPIELHRRLYEEHRIEVPVYRWNGGTWMRVSFQGYNDQEDVDALVAALERLLPELSARK